MTLRSSVPKVIPIENLKWDIAECLRIAVEKRHPDLVHRSMDLAGVMIEELKILANEGKYDRAYINELIKAYEKSKAEIEKKFSRKQ